MGREVWEERIVCISMTDACRGLTETIKFCKIITLSIKNKLINKKKKNSTDLM